MTPAILGLTCDLVNGETPTSFASRLAIRNMADSAPEFCLDMGLDWRALIRGDAAEIFRLADLAGVDGAILHRHAFHIVRRGHLCIGSEDVLSASLLRAQCRACLLCLMDRVAKFGFVGAFRGADWQFVSIRTCECHDVPLYRLPGEPIPLKNYAFAYMVRNHWPLIEDAARILPRYPRSGLEDYLRRRLAGNRGDEWIDQMPLSIISRASETLGALLEFGSNITAKQISEQQWHKAGSVGLDILQTGPTFLRRTLFENRGVFGGGTGYHNRDLGVFYAWLNFARRAQGIKPLRDLVIDHIVENYPLDPGVTVLGRRIEQPRCFTWTRARQRLRVRPARLVYLLDDLVPNSQVDNQISLTAHQVMELQDKLDDMISLADAEKTLGCQYDQIMHFVNSGMLTRWGKEAVRPYLSKKQVEAFVAPVLNLGATVPGQRLTSLGRTCTRTRACIHEVYQCFLDGKLASAYRNPKKTGLQSLLLDPMEVKFALPVPNVTDPTMIEVAKRLRTDPRTLRYLAEQGELRIYKTRNSVTRSIQSTVAKLELEEFQTEFMTIGEASALCEIPSGPLAIKLDAAGVSSRHVPNGISRIYRRQHIQRVLDAGLHKREARDIRRSGIRNVR